MNSEEAVQTRIREGRLMEKLDQMSPIYFEGIKRILTVSADTELISAPAYYHAAHDAPSLNAYISAMAIIQDELGHAHIAYRLLEDLGVDKEQLIYGRKPEAFKYPYAFDVPLASWVELVVANAFYDRAGFVLLGDVFKHTTFGPWKRALVKVDREENFHLRHGETWMRKIVEESGGRERLQRAVDWMFPLTIEWFGLPDDLKKQQQRQPAPNLDEHCRAAVRGTGPARTGALRSAARKVRPGLSLPFGVRCSGKALAVRHRPRFVGRRAQALEVARPEESGVRG
jgi:ring-1,2-phenylacetyl-CoA epoxidase subunit PaaA